MDIPLVFLLIIVCLHKTYSLKVYGLTLGGGNQNYIVEINTTTGALTRMDPKMTDIDDIYQGQSCFDQIKQTFYFTSMAALHSVDVLQKRELQLVDYSSNDVMVSLLSYDFNASRIIISYGNKYGGYYLYSYPITTDKHEGKPVQLADLSAVGITEVMWQAFDWVNKIFYSINQKVEMSQSPLLLSSFNLDDPTNVTVITFPCFQMYDVPFMIYDQVQNKLVGIMLNYTSTGEDYQYYAFVLENDMTCTISANLANIGQVTAATYDPITATYYLSSGTVTSALYIFETKTSKITIVPIDPIIFDIEVAYL